MTAFGAGIAAGVTTFRKAMVTSSPVPATGRNGVLEAFDSPDNRLGRYQLWWALFQNNAYDNEHAWAGKFKTEYSLERNIRGCYNPCFRTGNFWATHTWIGRLDAMKQDGRVADSACPILTKNEAVREPIGRLWRDSNWAVNKEVVARLGSVLGDFALRVEDDPRAGKVRILPVNPATIAWMRKDYQGNVDAYVIVEPRWDPRFDPRTQQPSQQRVVRYEERATRDGDRVHYQTLLDGEVYPWNGASGEYDAPYGFVPLVVSPHMMALPGSYWGWSELQGMLAKAVESDRVASDLHTQIRKASVPKFWVAGTRPPQGSSSVPHGTPTASNPQPQDHELPLFYGGPGSSIAPMVFTLDIQFTSMEIQNQLANLEKDYPELRYDSARATGDASAKALREVRKACEAKVHSRRVVYDDTLVRAHKMALSIGGMRGYEGYDGFSLSSYAAGALDHSIGERTVFLLDPLDRSEELNAMLVNWQVAKLAGVPAEFFLRLNDFGDEQIALFKDLLAAEQAQALQQQVILMQAQAAAKAAAAPAPGPAA